MAGSGSHLVGAHAIFWRRDAVNWKPGSGSNAWQMLGYHHKNRPALRICDFRKSKGFYVLFDEFRATYAGLAQGNGGIGERLLVHHQDKSKRWNRFCWFAFDDVIDYASNACWAVVKPRKTLRGATAESVLRECEALLIEILGLRDQNRMRFAGSQEWTQLTAADFVKGGVGLKTDEVMYTDIAFQKLYRSNRPAATHP